MILGNYGFVEIVAALLGPAGICIPALSLPVIDSVRAVTGFIRLEDNVYFVLLFVVDPQTAGPLHTPEPPRAPPWTWTISGLERFGRSRFGFTS